MSGSLDLKNMTEADFNLALGVTVTDTFGQTVLTPGKDFVLSIVPVGSRVTCDPPPTDTDRDWLVMVTDINDFAELVDDAGWEYGGSGEGDPDFMSFRKGIDNLIVTDDLFFYDKFMLASTLAKRFNLMKKEDRVALFQAVLYNNDVSATPPVRAGVDEEIFA